MINEPHLKTANLEICFHLFEQKNHGIPRFPRVWLNNFEEGLTIHTWVCFAIALNWCENKALKM